MLLLPKKITRGALPFFLIMAAFVLSQEANLLISAGVIIPAASWMAYKTVQQRKAAYTHIFSRSSPASLTMHSGSHSPLPSCIE